MAKFSWLGQPQLVVALTSTMKVQINIREISLNCYLPKAYVSSLVRVLQATLRRGADGSTRCGTPATPRSTFRSSHRCRSTSRPPGSRSSSTSTSSSPSSRPELGSSSRTSTTSASSVSHVVLKSCGIRMWSASMLAFVEHCGSGSKRKHEWLKT